VKSLNLAAQLRKLASKDSNPVSIFADPLLELLSGRYNNNINVVRTLFELPVVIEVYGRFVAILLLRSGKPVLIAF
jgi:hypothetical protein